MIGQTLRQYRILEKLGSGGMGVVYKAEDTSLQRLVAIKVLPADFQSEEQKARFMREARAAAALDHPNICPIHEVIADETGTFLVMSYVDGGSLKMMGQKRPGIDEIVRIAAQICSGLEAAHRKSIVHRDIKPQNILLTRDGLVRIVDFGLACHLDETRITPVGLTLGTPAYMSPEQWSGEPVDHRSDLWSFGVVLYELLAGKLPFSGERAASFGYAVVHQEPPPIEPLRQEVPPALADLTMKLLAKDPAQRPPSAGACLAVLNQFRGASAQLTSRPPEAATQTLAIRELPKPLTTGVVPRADDTIIISRRRLTWLASGAAGLGAAGVGIYTLLSRGKDAVPPAPTSVAVLPFVTPGGPGAVDYLSEGLADEVTNALTKARSLKVVARTSAFQFRDKQQDLRRIGEQLAVEALVTGTVSREGGHIRVNVQLVNAKDGYQIWSEIYDRPAGAIFSVQQEIARQILRRLDPAHPAELTANTRDPDTSAYNLYLQGRYMWNKRSEASFRAAIQFFDKAVTADPLYPQPYSGLADSYALLGLFGYAPPKDTLPMAKAAANKALELDSTLAEAHVSLGLALLIYDWNFVESERAFQRGLALSPGYATGAHWYAHSLLWTGRFDEAMKQIDRALQLDPLALSVRTNVGWFWYIQRKYDRAIEVLRSVLALDPGFRRAQIYLAAAYAQSGRYEEAFRVIDDAKSPLSEDERLMSSARTLALAGRVAEAREKVKQLEVLARQRYISPYVIAMVHAANKDFDPAFAALESAYQERSAMLIFLMVDPRLDNLRGDSRFAALTKKMGWPA